MFLAGFDLSEDSETYGLDGFNGSNNINLTAGHLQSVELMGLQCSKECYAISIATALTFMAGVYQVNKHLYLKLCSDFRYEINVACAVHSSHFGAIFFKAFVEFVII